ncbi:MAG: hypothetical protein IPH78_10040 [Bacteroidetes bacterium]|nr:hypothetical protein [Bacteroidota bacterium]
MKAGERVYFYYCGMNRLDTLLKMAADKPHDPFLQYALALEYVSLQQADKALAFFAALIEEHPAYLPTYYQYGQWLESNGQNTEALRIYTQGHQLAMQLHDTKTARELQQAMDNIED